jgi:hypothetical protein
MIKSEQLAEQFIDMSKAIKRVRDLHIPRTAYDGSLVCVACESFYEDSGAVDYPCPTIKALDGEQDG